MSFLEGLVKKKKRKDIEYSVLQFLAFFGEKISPESVFSGDRRRVWIDDIASEELSLSLSPLAVNLERESL